MERRTIVGKKAAIAVIVLVAAAGLLRMAHVVDFVAILKRMHGG